MSTYTDSLGLEEVTPGDQAGLWGNTTNNNLALIDQAVTGVTPISFLGLSGTVYTLESSNGALDEARAAVLNITGTATGANTVVVPNKQKTYLVRNNTGQNVTFRTATPTATYAVEAGNSILVFCDGNNNVFTGIASPSVGTLSVSAGGTGATTFTAGFVKSPGGTTALTSSSAVALGADVSGVLPVSNGGTGAGTFTSGSLIVGNGTSNFGTLVGGGVGQVATWNGSTWTAATPATGAVTSVTSGGNISVSPTTGSVVVTLSGANVISALGYTPGTGNGNVSTGTTNNFTGTNNYSTSASIAMQGSNIGDQRVFVQGAGFASGMAPSNIQIGVSGGGIIYSGSLTRMEIALSGVRAYFETSGNYQANNSPNWATVSDINIKTNLRPISSVLDKINALKPCHFEYKDKLGDVQTGFIAQEFAIVFPGHAMDTPADDRYKGFLPEGETKLKSIDTNLTAYLVKAIQELSAKVDAQAAEIAALKAK